MPKVFYTERDIDEMKARGVTSLDITDNVVVTDAALERAMKYDMKITRADSSSAPKAALSGSVNLVAADPRTDSCGVAEVNQRINSAVLAKLDAVISRVVSSLK
mgnify:CR=1 FL=1